MKQLRSLFLPSLAVLVLGTALATAPTAEAFFFRPRVNFGTRSYYSGPGGYYYNQAYRTTVPYNYGYYGSYPYGGSGYYYSTPWSSYYNRFNYNPGYYSPYAGYYNYTYPYYGY